MVDSITYRTNDATRWGTGKGSDLTATEIDINFWVLFSQIAAIVDHQNVAGVISSISASGNNLFITLGDGTVFGPFTLPTAQWTFRGAWLPNTLYNPMDVITSNGGLYLVLVRHTSVATFNPTANDGQGHSFYQLMLGPGPYDVGMFFPDRIPEASPTNPALLLHVAARSFWLPRNFSGSVANLNVAATDELIFPVYKNQTPIGSILFGGSHAYVQSDGSEFGTFVSSAAVQFNRLDRLVIAPPAASSTGPDATAQGLAATLAGVVGIFAP
jgi:hypothetical protein